MKYVLPLLLVSINSIASVVSVSKLDALHGEASRVLNVPVTQLSCTPYTTNNFSCQSHKTKSTVAVNVCTQGSDYLATAILIDPVKGE